MRTMSESGAHLIGDIKPDRVKERSDEVLELPPPRSDGSPLLSLLAQRQSRRVFSRRVLPLELLSDLLWAAFGVNRPETTGRTAPSGLNVQEIDVYVAVATGVYLFEANAHRLHRVARIDARRVTGYQDFVDDAPLDLIYVADRAPARSLLGSQQDMFAAVCAGAVAQNVYLFCAEQGLNTVVRAWFNARVLGDALQLGPDERVLLTQTVGYPPEE
jgi:nitroreductase